MTSPSAIPAPSSSSSSATSRRHLLRSGGVGAAVLAGALAVTPAPAQAAPAGGKAGSAPGS